MSRSRRSLRPQRTPVFFGCEGEGELGYGALLARLLDEQQRHIHLDTVVLRPGGGDPCALVELAVSRLADAQRKRGVRYRHKVILLDADKLGESKDRDARALVIAQRNRLHLVWQRPCHEAFLLRHLPGFQAHRPPAPPLAMTALRRQWADYAKPMSAIRLAEKIGAAAVRLARTVEPELDALLNLLLFE